MDSTPRDRGRPGDRFDREVWYGGWTLSPSAVDVDAIRPVRTPDGGFYLEAMDAHGGHVATARALLRVLDRVWLSGHPRCRAPFCRMAIYGALPGTCALVSQPNPSTNVVVLGNRFPCDPWTLVRTLDRLLVH